MQLTIGISELLALLILIGAVFLVYLIVTLARLNVTIKNVNLLLDKNRENIDRTINALPEICDNIDNITKSLKDKSALLDQYLTKHEEVAASVDLEAVLSTFTTIVNLFSDIKNYFGGRKKNRD